MDIEYYRNFITIVECGSISGAAKKIAIAQPALSNQVKILQQKFGAPLLNTKRGGHSLDLTPAGAILYNKAKYICSTEEATIREIKDYNAGFSGTLAMSLSPSTSIDFIRNFLGRFSREYPDINYELYEVPIKELTEQLLSGQTEIGIANAPLLQPQRFEVVFSRKEKLVAVCNKHSRFLEFNRSSVLLEELEEAPICLSRGCSELFLNTCYDSKIFPLVMSENTTKMSAVAWAEVDAGVAIIPASYTETFGENVKTFDIKDERLYLDKALITVKDRPLSTIAKTFLNYYSKMV
ncbi:MAG: LysR family transcriptional regulator [Phascolarctobacterium sp.]|nr:LysR family transcriptional regulator [Phascolarctobacterium sp.]